MPVHYPVLHLDTTSGSIEIQEPQFNVGSSVTVYPAAPDDYYTFRPEDLNFTLDVSKVNIDRIAYTDSDLTRLAQTMEELGISADNAAELLRKFSHVDCLSFYANDDPEEIEQSEELDEFLDGFSVDRQEVI